ncbi:glycine betaine ABC transporter substrate-binding protein [Enterococcus faecalis]|uniref:glycine betaine ABC transporter substrate-binding protein n=1 Tax=Enterococcus faecalis TaxID=1351 RepID=UPI00235DD7C4|nr:glycine betaine ABC transporter substrate-binding protein [Enterococcus faecalis]
MICRNILHSFAFLPHYFVSMFHVPLGGYEEIHSYAREGLKEDNPEAYKIIDNFYWEVEDMSSVMEELATDVEPEEAADNWIEANRETVDGWLE